MSRVYFFYLLRSTSSHCFHWLVSNLSPTSISLPCILIGYHLLGSFSFSLYRPSALPVFNRITAPPPLSLLLAATHPRRNNITTSEGHNDIIASVSLSPFALSQSGVVTSDKFAGACLCSALTAAVSIYMPHKATSATTRILYDGQHLPLVNDQLRM